MLARLRLISLGLCVISLPIGCSVESKPTVTSETAKSVADSSEAAIEVSLDALDSNTTKISILAWNAESGGADPEVIAERLVRLAEYEIVCLSEVHPDDFETYLKAKGPDFADLRSRSGNEDRLQIIYNKNRFELLQEMELNQHGSYTLNNGGHRSPTAVRLRDRESGQAFIVMVNHLARGNADFRKQQAIGLREWARDQETAVVNIGDFNMDYEFATGKGNDALDEILRDNVFTWVQPKTWIDSNWWDPDGDGVDNFDGSLLDFAFVSGPAKTWKPQCEVLVEFNDFPDDATTSDHRPISLTLTINAENKLAKP